MFAAYLPNDLDACQGTAIRDQIQERLLGQQSREAGYLLEHGDEDVGDDDDYYEDNDGDEYYFDDEDYYYGGEEDKKEKE